MQDLAAAEVLRKYNTKVNDLFLDSAPEVKAVTTARETRESDILETARLDGGWTRRERARLKFEVEEGLRCGDAYDRHWLQKRTTAVGLEAGEVNAVDVEQWRKEVAFLTAVESTENTVNSQLQVEDEEAAADEDQVDSTPDGSGR